MYAFFTPGTDPKTQIITSINAAESLIAGFFQVYADGDIHDALVAAQARMGYVFAIFDRRQQFLEDTRLKELQDAGVVVLIDNHCRQLRGNYLVIDDYWVITGSYLYTGVYDAHYASQISIIDAFTIYDLYLANWVEHYDHSDLYVDPWPPD